MVPIQSEPIDRLAALSRTLSESRMRMTPILCRRARRTGCHGTHGVPQTELLPSPAVDTARRAANSQPRTHQTQSISAPYRLLPQDKQK